ncbi:MAG: hypothetical protein AAB420_04425 [Patescibacteria group bacterium]
MNNIFQLPRRYYIYALVIFLAHSLLVFLPFFADETPYGKAAFPVLTIGIPLAFPVLLVNFYVIWPLRYGVDMDRYYHDSMYSVSAYPTETFGFTVGLFSFLYAFLYLYIIQRKFVKYRQEDITTLERS